MGITIALVGNPNCGKTTMFNALTGSNQYVGNWAGVTVEKKEGYFKNDKSVKIVDLPGIYSLSPYTLEEVITREYIIKEKPDVIINIVDASNIERNLYLTTQVLEMGIPTIIALNMMDIVKKRGDSIDVKMLSNELTKTVETSALKEEGLQNLIEEAIKISKNPYSLKNDSIFSDKLKSVLKNIEDIIETEEEKKWLSTKIFEKDEKILKEINLSNEQKQKINDIIQQAEKDFGDESESIIINERYVYITDLVKKAFAKKVDEKLTISDKIDKIVTNKFLGLPIFFGIIFLIYYISVTTLGSLVTDWTNDVFFGEYVTNFVSGILEKLNVSSWVYSLVIDGIIGGVGAVLGFVPQMLILFTFLCFLEDCGYMSRVAFIMDRVFRKIGLSGKSFIPMIISSGCGVAGIMSSRTIENEKDRKITIMVTTFIPCSAKLPIIALIGASIFSNNPLVGPSVYFASILMVIISGLILKKLKIFEGESSPFIMELPQYHMPLPKVLLKHIWDRVRAFIIKAGTIIFIASMILWFLSNFNFKFEMVGSEESILATIGTILAPVFTPLGFGNWQATVATINGLIAKEQLVSTFGILFGLGDVTETDAGLNMQIANMFNVVSAYSFVMFNMLCAPCIAAIGAIKREMISWKWTFITLGYQTLLAYLVSFVTYQLGSVLVLKASFGLGTILAILVLIFAIYMIVRKPKKSK